MNEPKASRISPEQAFAAAVDLHRGGRLSEAAQFYRKILELMPAHFGALHYLGLVCTQQRSFEEAVELLRKAVALDPCSFEARTNLGIALVGLQRLDEAMEEYRRAIALRPDYAEARNNLGIALQGLGRHAEALAHFEAVAALRPATAVVHHNLGGALAALDRHEEAAIAFRQAIALDPRLAEAHNRLGRALAALGRDEEAVEPFRQAIVLKPDDAESLGNLAAAYHRLKRHEEAIAHFERALALQPDLAEAHNDIGNALVALERTEEAVERYRRALAIRPQFADAHDNIGNALVMLNRHREAVPHFKASLSIKPDVFETLISLGGALSQAERNEEAIASYRKAVELRPDSASTHWLLGGALEAAGRSEEAVAEHRQALAIEPDFAGAYNALGFSLVALGRLEEGRVAVERAIALAPATGHFHRNLAMAKRYAEGDPQLLAMEELARGAASLDSEDRMELHFALGKAYADLHRQEEALRHLIEANAIKRSKLEYDEADTLAQFDRIKQVMTAELMQRKSGAGARSGLPIFILGMPRSGTTLIEQILASHPDVYGAGELGNFSRIVSSYCNVSGKQVLYTEVVPDMPGEQLGEIGARYLESVRVLSPDTPRITDKMPANFRFAGLIHLALPGARIIHARRDPLATCLSCFERHFARDNQPFTYDLAELGRYYRAYQGLMAHWREVLPDGAVLDVQYEDVVQDLESQARRVIEYCGLDWDPRCLAFHRTERPVHTASVVQVREPIYRSSLGRWQPVRHMLGPLLNELGIEA